MPARILSAVAMLSVTLGLSALLAGCAHERHEVIPPNAMLGAEGQGELNYSTTGSGTVYVHDTVDNKLLYSGDVNGVRTVTVDPEKSKIFVDGAVVTDKTLVRGHNHKIFFIPRYR